jgi:hypothetical protein
MTVATYEDHGTHDIHAKGLAALMKAGYLPKAHPNMVPSNLAEQFQVSRPFSARKNYVIISTANIEDDFM